MFNFDSIPFMMLYAEIHFRFFRFFPSFLFRRQPEIVFDCPRRLGPEMDLPISLTIHDCIRFPINLKEVSISVSAPSFPAKVFSFSDFHNHELKHSLQQNLRTFIFPIPRDGLSDGEMYINAKAVIQDCKKREHIILNDNIPTSSRLSFLCTVSSEVLPASHLCSYGDFHVHSSFSESHVEFGPPIEATSRTAAACGLDFINVTDHSYDLSCEPNNYLKTDPSMKRWNAFLHESNNAFPSIVMRGEEVSCLNSNNQVVHLCGSYLTDFIPGSLDGARGNFEATKQLTIKEAVGEIHHQNGIAFAAHPGSQKTLMQSIFLRRGHWNEIDCTNTLDGFQAYNGSFSSSWERAIILWKRMLAKGQRVPLLAGNDAHGDFNRYRSIKTPFLSIYESTERYFGNGKTGIYARCSSDEEIKNAILKGKSFVTNGPYVSINSDTSETSSVINNSGLPFGSTSFFAHCISTVEFGRIYKLIIYGLHIQEKKENIIIEKSYQKLLYNVFEPLTLGNIVSYRYIRAELHTITENGTVFKAFTSGCFNQIAST
jgi:histidinol phosphatase-like PHP family hydrolase